MRAATARDVLQQVGLAAAPRPLPAPALGRRAAARRHRPRVRDAARVLFADEPTGNLDTTTGAPRHRAAVRPQCRQRDDAGAGDARPRDRGALQPRDRARRRADGERGEGAPFRAARAPARLALRRARRAAAGAARRGRGADRRRLLHRPRQPGRRRSAPRRCSRQTCACVGTDPVSTRLRRARASAALQPRARSASRASCSTARTRRSPRSARSAPAIRCAASSRLSDAPFAPGAGDGRAPGARRGLARLAPARAARRGRRRSRQRRRAAFTVTRVLDYRPDQGSAFTDLAPTLLIPIEDVPATELLGPGSRATYSLLFAGEPADIRAFRTEIRERKTKRRAAGRVAEESPQIQSSTRRAGRFLNLSAMITVLLAAIAVAMAARRYAQRHLDSVALMKCMGAPQRLVLQVTVIELALVALVAAGRRRRARLPRAGAARRGCCGTSCAPTCRRRRSRRPGSARRPRSRSSSASRCRRCCS